MSTTLVLSRITFQGRHGATEIERRSLRAFEVDVEIDVPLDQACRSDHLGDTIDYREVAQIIVELGTAEPRHLLESLCGSMLERLVARFPAARFRIELRKLCPPSCPGQPAHAAVRMDSAVSRQAREAIDLPLGLG
ncbi:MAG: dihydroneopterin aldolase [Polyangia bacterium]|jgi:dihydroneopterin aldolase